MCPCMRACTFASMMHLPSMSYHASHTSLTVHYITLRNIVLHCTAFASPSRWEPPLPGCGGHDDGPRRAAGGGAAGGGAAGAPRALPEGGPDLSGARSGPVSAHDRAFISTLPGPVREVPCGGAARAACLFSAPRPSPRFAPYGRHRLCSHSSQLLRRELGQG